MGQNITVDSFAKMIFLSMWIITFSSYQVIGQKVKKENILYIYHNSMQELVKSYGENISIILNKSSQYSDSTIIKLMRCGMLKGSLLQHSMKNQSQEWTDYALSDMAKKIIYIYSEDQFDEYTNSHGYSYLLLFCEKKKVNNVELYSLALEKEVLYNFEIIIKNDQIRIKYCGIML